MATITTRTLPTPPPVSSYPLPSPSKKDPELRPNPHPYAIKTTSTGILTRSNSSGYNVNATHHYYIPTSPSPSRSDPAKGHRPSKSLSYVPESPGRESPRPLPIPPALDSPNIRRDGSGGSGGYVSADEAASMPPRRPRRSSTLPIIPIPSPALSAPSVDDLPENPKLWTPSQLAVYLITALRMTSGGKPGEIESIGLPALVAKDIAAFVKSARIGGRTFLRLNEDDLEGLGMNKKWRDALLTAARNLRQNVLKGRIWGVDGSPATSPSPQSASPPTLFSNPELNSSSSSIESGAGEDESTSPGAVLGRSKARRYRSGRVRGMIETFERSGSFSSDGGLEGEDGPVDERTNLRRWARQEGRITGQRVVESPSPSKRRPLPMPPSPSGSHSSRVGADDEPTMEALLAELSKQPVTGARAWEEMDLDPGVTVKHIPDGQAEAQTIYLDAIPETITGLKTVAGLGSGRSSGGSSKGKSERRVVTAIFAPSSPSKDALRPLEPTNGLEAFPVGDASPERQQKSRPLPATPADGPAAEGEHLPQPVEPELESTHLERLLEEEILATRALLETFRARLEVVEQKVADLETKEVVRERELAFALHSQTRPAAEAGTETKRTVPCVDVGVQSSAATAVDAKVQSDTPAESSVSPSDSDPSPHAPSSTASEAANANAAPGSSSAGAITITNRKGKGKAGAASVLASTAASASALQAVTSEVVRRLHAPASSLFASSSALAAREDADENDGEGTHPATVGDLPSYVLLVGLGVCAVVVQVVLRKVVGKGSGLRP